MSTSKSEMCRQVLHYKMNKRQRGEKCTSTDEIQEWVETCSYTSWALSKKHPIIVCIQKYEKQYLGFAKQSSINLKLIFKIERAQHRTKWALRKGKQKSQIERARSVHNNPLWIQDVQHSKWDLECEHTMSYTMECGEIRCYEVYITCYIYLHTQTKQDNLGLWMYLM